MQKVSVLVGAEIGVAIGWGKTPCLTTEYAHRWNSYGLQHVMDIEYIGCAMRQRDRHGKDEGKAQQMEIRGGGKANSLTTVNKANCLMAKENTDFMKYEGPRIINIFGKKVRVLGIRRLTPTECARLQTIPTWYKWECFETKEEIKEGEICNNVKLKGVCSLLQTETLGYATSTICDLLGQEQQNSEESLLTQLKSVSWTAATAEGEPLKVSASSITKNGNESNQPTQQKNALFVENRSDAPDATECVVSITLHGSDMETLYIPTNVNTSLMEILGQNTTKLTESSFIGLLQKKYSEDSSEKTKLFITSTLINWIIARTIFTSAQTKNICVCIGNSSEWQRHSLKTDLLYLRTGIIKKTSDSSCYRMLGNGWTVEVIKHFFKELPDAWKIKDR